MIVYQNTKEWTFWKETQTEMLVYIERRILDLKCRNKTTEAILKIIRKEYSKWNGIPYKIAISDSFNVIFDPSFVD